MTIISWANTVLPVVRRPSGTGLAGSEWDIVVIR